MTSPSSSPSTRQIMQVRTISSTHSDEKIPVSVTHEGKRFSIISERSEDGTKYIAKIQRNAPEGKYEVMYEAFKGTLETLSYAEGDESPTLRKTNSIFVRIDDDGHIEAHVQGDPSLVYKLNQAS